MSLYITDENGELHKLAGAGGGSSIVVDSELNAESENPVQNKVLYNPVTFAESERQKSKNLFNINAPRVVQGGHSFVNGNTITVEAGGSTETDAVFGLIAVKENTTYYIGANSSIKRLLFRIYDENKNVITSAIPNWQYNQHWKASYHDFETTDIITQITIPQGAKYLALQTSWQSFEYTISNVIISEYSDVDNYQEWNGEIIREKEVASLLNNGGGSAESELVAEVALTEASQEITFNNLDIADDGGIYDFVLTVPYVSETYVYVKINNITSGYASIIEVMYYSSSGNPDHSFVNAQNKNYWEIGYNFGAGSCVGTITLNNGIVSCHTKYYAQKGVSGALLTTGGQVNASNITSITFGTVVGGGPAFPVGTTVKIFKRDTNVQTRS